MRHMLHPRSLVLTVAVAGLTPALASAVPAFTFDQSFFAATVGDTGGIPNPGRSQAYAINDAGQITGYTLASTGGVNGITQYVRGYVYNSVPGPTPAFRPLPPLGGITSLGRGINASGQVVGLSSTSDSVSTAYHATRWDTPANAVDVPPLAGFVSSTAAGISDNGQVCGSLFPTATTGYDVGERAFKTVNGQVVALPNLPGTAHSDGYGINNVGTVAGYSDNPNGSGFVFGTYWDASGVHPITPIGGDYSITYQINNNGVTAGGSTIAADNDAEVAILFDTTTGMTKNLGGVNAAFRYAEAIGLTGGSTLNNATVVGVAYNADFTVTHAFVYLNGTMYDLNDVANLPAGVELQYAYGINASNQIVGSGIDADGNSRAFLLNLSSVPEPASLGLDLPPSNESGCYVKIAVTLKGIEHVEESSQARADHRQIA